MTTTQWPVAGTGQDTRTRAQRDSIRCGVPGPGLAKNPYRLPGTVNALVVRNSQEAESLPVRRNSL